MSGAPIITTGRRTLLGGAAVALTWCRAAAQPAFQTIDLWPGAPPGGAGPQGPERVDTSGNVTNISRPRIRAYRPAKPNGMAVIVVAGGGYRRIGMGRESTPTSRWLQTQGITAFELVYRLPGENWPHDAPLQDGQRAMRLVRSLAASFSIDAGRIGMIGFSAGGHLTGMTAVRPETQRYPQTDAIDKLPARPDFCALIYPVLTLMPPFDRTNTRRELLGKHPSLADSAAYSVERHVGAAAPPVFLAQAADDPTAPPENSLMMFNALRAANVAAEMHMFQTGGHGWGLGQAGSEVQAWPVLFARWALAKSIAVRP